jgi:hypothetical protein
MIAIRPNQHVIGQISNAYVYCRIAPIAAVADVPEAHEVGVQ